MTLGFLARALIQAAAAHLIVSTLVSLAVAITWPAVAARRGPAIIVARRLFRARMAPSAAGLAAAMLVLMAYALWEPRVDVEPVGAVARATAAAGAVLTGAAVIRGARALRHSRDVQRALVRASGGALPALPMPAFLIESRFPIVAVVGLVMSRLFVARRVIEVCTAEEFDAVVAHEHAHARAHDNLRRLAMTASPDLLALLPAGRRLQEGWTEAAELAADEWAARHTAGGLHLAAALVKVARLAVTPAPPLTASTLFEGQPITERVRRLLAPPPAPVHVPGPTWRRAITVLLLLGAAVASLPAVYAAAEQILKLGL